MAKFDEKLDRMNFLMEFQSPKSSVNASPVEYHTEGADGKVYGILKEGSKYYIKTTEKGKETIAESYNYVNGFNNKKDYEYNGYNEATKQLELKLMSLNEAYGSKKKTSTVNFNKSQENFSYLTEEARKELDRMNRIFENSGKIGKDNTTPVEYHGTASGDDTKKNNNPFNIPAKAELDKDLKATETNPANATGEGFTDAPKDMNKDLQSDKMKGKGKSEDQCFEKKVNDGDVDSEGESVTTKEPKGGKVVKVNESFDAMDDIDLVGDDNDDEFEEEEGNLPPVETLGAEDFGAYDDDEEGDLGVEDFETEPTYDEDEDLDAILEEIEGYGKCDKSNAKKSIITGPEDSLDGPNTSDNENNSVAYGEKRVGPDNGIMKEDTGSALPADEKVMRGPKGNGKSIAYGEKRVGGDNGVMNESMVKSLVNDVMGKLLKENKKSKKNIKENVKECGVNTTETELKENTEECVNIPKKENKSKKKETIQEAIQRIVNEEITHLNAWGKHPRYQKEPMQLPPNKEVMKGTADRDWNDESAKGDAPYGRKIGSSAPFDVVVAKITDSVIQSLKEGKVDLNSCGNCEDGSWKRNKKKPLKMNSKRER